MLLFAGQLIAAGCVPRDTVTDLRYNDMEMALRSAQQATTDGTSLSPNCLHNVQVIARGIPCGINPDGVMRAIEQLPCPPREPQEDENTSCTQVERNRKRSKIYTKVLLLTSLLTTVLCATFYDLGINHAEDLAASLDNKCYITHSCENNFKLPVDNFMDPNSGDIRNRYRSKVGPYFEEQNTPRIDVETGQLTTRPICTRKNLGTGGNGNDLTVREDCRRDQHDKDAAYKLAHNLLAGVVLGTLFTFGSSWRHCILWAKEAENQ